MPLGAAMLNNIKVAASFSNGMRFLSFLLLCIPFHVGFAQSPINSTSYDGKYLLETVVVDGDTMPVVTLRATYISSNRKARSKRYQRKWTKLQRNVVKTYPYAEVAGKLIRAYNDNLKDLPTEAQREAYLEKCEEDLRAEFEGDLTKMTTSQGRVLIKLIDRETGNTGYELIKQLRSGFTAFMWQGVAKLFGTDLKANYDPFNDETDFMIEEIVAMIESGQLFVQKRNVQTTAASEVLKSSDQKLQRRIEREERRAERKR